MSYIWQNSNLWTCDFLQRFSFKFLHFQLLFSILFFLFFWSFIDLHHKPFLFTIYSVPSQSNIINIGITSRKIFNSSLAFLYLVFSSYGLCRAYILKPDALSGADVSFYDISPPTIFYCIFPNLFYHWNTSWDKFNNLMQMFYILKKKKKKKITTCYYPKLMGFIDQPIWHQSFIIKQLYICVVNWCFIQHNSGHAVRLCQVSLALSFFFFLKRFYDANIIGSFYKHF